MTLADLAKGRDNNLTLMRLLAAIAVLVSHSFVLATGDPRTEPLRTWIGMTPGSIAVDVFFAVSGFLVTASLTKSRDVLDFVTARSLRIFPALLVMLAVTVLVVGPAVTTAPISTYFGVQTISYFVKCATLINGVTFQLPGVFGENPYRAAVNGSLWTMPWEVRSYGALLLVWCATAATGKFSSRTFLVTTYVVAISLYVWLQALHQKESSYVYIVSPLTMFAFGVVLWQLREWVQLGWRGFAASAALLFVTPLGSVHVFYAVYPFALTFAVMFLAFVPGGVVRRYNLMGDYSYGLYLYAFPIQQLLASAWPGIRPGQMILSSFVITMLCAALSWHLIEKRALAMRGRIVSRLRSIRIAR